MAGKSVRIRARISGVGSVCPACGAASVRVHSRYERRLADTAAGGQETLVHLQVRRFFCQNGACPRVTFAEQVTGLTSRYARRTTGLGETLGAVALALGGRAGARLSGRLACPVSRSTLLRLIRALPEPSFAAPRVLGVDDFALRRGHVYGTVLVDIETRRPVDLLPERSADSFGSWLDSRPGVEVICRDRGGCYAEGAARGAPLAIQVADRWHLLHNLADAVERAAARHRSCLRDEASQPETAPAIQPPAQGQRANRTRYRHAEVHAALARGLTITQISRALHLDRKTVRRYATTPDPGDLCSGTRAVQPGLLDPYLPYLHQRWDEGCRGTEQLHREIRARGYRGSLRTLRRHTARLRRETARQPLRQRPRQRKWPPGSSPRPATSPTTTAPPSTPSPADALNSPPPAPWSASSPACSCTAPAATSPAGLIRPRPAPSASYVASPPACARTGQPLLPGSPCPGAPAPSKATSTGSR